MGVQKHNFGTHDFHLAKTHLSLTPLPVPHRTKRRVDGESLERPFPLWTMFDPK